MRTKVGYCKTTAFNSVFSVLWIESWEGKNVTVFFRFKEKYAIFTELSQDSFEQYV